MNFENARFRFAPSPSGFLHIGGVRTALFNWLLAKKHNGRFILRIEDTDRERTTQESIDAILDGFQWLGIDWDEGPGKEGPYGPYFQSQRKETYDPCTTKLIAQKKAYRCFCTKEELDAKRQAAENAKKQYAYDRTCFHLTEEQVQEKMTQGLPYSVRLVTDTSATPLAFDDMIRGTIDFSVNQFDDFIIVRPDGMPVYNYAVTIDDALMKITHVIRGDDHISNTPRQILIYRALGFDVPAFGHLPMILGADGSRLSKRHGATAVQQYRDEGYLPEALLNFLARLGWSYDDTQEIFRINDLIAKFSVEKVNKSPAVFNQQKLLWLNAEYVKFLTTEEKYIQCKPFFLKSGLLNEETYTEKKDLILKALEMAGERIKLLPQAVDHTHFLFRETLSYDEDAYAKFIKVDFVPAFFKSISEQFASLADFENASIEKVLRDTITQQGLNTKKAMQAIRVALAGSSVSPDLMTMICLYGKERTISRFREILQREGHL